MKNSIYSQKIKNFCIKVQIRDKFNYLTKDKFHNQIKEMLLNLTREKIKRKRKRSK